MNPRLHRAAVLVTATVLLADAVLLATGVLSVRQAVLLTLCVELPCSALVTGATVLGFRRLRRQGLTRRAAAERLVGTTPVRLAVGELRSLRALYLVARRRTDPLTGVRLAYGRGLTGTVVAFLLAGGVETVVLHVLLPGGWLRDLLTVLSVYALVAVLGLALSRTAYPHVVRAGQLHLRSGVTDVVAVDLADVARVVVRRRFDVVGLWPTVADDALHLPSLDGTSLDLELARPLTVPARGRRSPAAAVHRVSLHVDDPEAAAALLRAARTPGPRSPVGG